MNTTTTPGKAARQAWRTNPNGAADACSVTTTLASSRWKNLDQVNEAGRWACSQVQGVTWWDQNWRKGGLQERRNQIIKEEKFYNQLYCGCEYSQKKPGQ